MTAHFLESSRRPVHHIMFIAVQHDRELWNPLEF